MSYLIILFGFLGYGLIAFIGTKIKPEGRIYLPLATSISVLFSSSVWLHLDNSLNINFVMLETREMLTVYPAAYVLPLLWPLTHFFRAKGMSGNSIISSTVLANTQIFYTIIIEALFIGVIFIMSFYLGVLAMLTAMWLTFNKSSEITFNTASVFMLLYAVLAASLNTMDSYIMKAFDIHPAIILIWANFLPLIYHFHKVIELKKHLAVVSIGAIQLVTLPILLYILKHEGSSYAVLVVATGYVLSKLIINMWHKDIAMKRAFAISFFALVGISTALFGDLIIIS